MCVLPDTGKALGSGGGTLGRVCGWGLTGDNMSKAGRGFALTSQMTN